MSDFSKRLKELRNNKGLSQEELANLIGVHKSHISRYERGISIPSIEAATKLANALGISISKFVIQDSNPNKDIELDNLFEQATHLNDSDKKVVKELLSAFIFKREMQNRLEEE